MRKTLIATTVLLVCADPVTPFAADRLTVTPIRATVPLFNYEDAPATPDADDPAVWINRNDPRQSLVIATAKNAGLLVYDLAGQLVQALFPPNTRQVLPADPATPAGLNPAPDKPCSDSEGMKTFGRYNNVDIAYDVASGGGPVDVAVVSDRGCDRVRFFRIDLASPDGPLVDITSPDVPRVFPDRYEQPSALQPSGAVEGWRDNPVDDQNTVYGLTVAQGTHDEVFVTQRERGMARQLRISQAGNGRLTYSIVRSFLFDTSVELLDAHGASYPWTPCREAANEEPQAEGVAFDVVNNTLFVAFETIGLYKVPLTSSMPALVTIGVKRLVEPIKSFGQPYHAVPDDDEFECEYNPSAPPAAGDVVAVGSDVHAGRFLAADLEGLSIVASRVGQTLMLASSQGDSSFHFYRIQDTKVRHVGTFRIEGVGESDGVHYVAGHYGKSFPNGLLVVQNGDAPEPADTSDVNGYEFDGSTQFMYVNFVQTLEALRFE